MRRAISKLFSEVHEVLPSLVVREVAMSLPGVATGLTIRSSKPSAHSMPSTPMI
jgi:hypothetical protein